MLKNVVHGWLFRWVLSSLVGLTTPCIASAAGGSLPPPRQTLDLILPSNSLPALTLRVMREEAERIWAREGVAITWRANEAQVPVGASFVRLSFLGDVNGTYVDKTFYTLGDFLPDEQRIRVSLFAASRAVTQGNAASRQRQPPFMQPLALGYVLGRAIAHEVGHALLGKEHSDSGLMTPSFPPAAMIDVKSSRFRLDEEDAARLKSDDASPRVAIRSDDSRLIAGESVTSADGTLARE